MDLEKLMRMKVSNLYCWADQEHLSQKEVYKVMTEMKDKKTSAGSGETIGTEYQQNIQVIQKGLPKTPKEKHKYATMAPPRPPPDLRRTPRKFSNKNDIGKGEEEKEENAKRTRTVLSTYLEKIKKVGVIFRFVNLCKRVANKFAYPIE